MIDFSTGYSYREILDAMLDQVDSGLDKREGSLIQTALGPLAWYLEGLALTLSNIQKAAYAETAEGSDLDMLAETRGITRRAATPAVRNGAFNVAIPEGSLFRTLGDTDSVVFVSGESLGTSQGLYLYRMTCQTAGTVGNSYSGALIPVTAISGLTMAVLGTIITEGADQESDAALRTRYMATFDTAPYGGNISEYRQAILAIPGVGAVQVYPANLYQGGGTCLCSIVDADYGPASAGLVKTVQDAICPPEEGGTDPSPHGYGIAPIGAAVTIRSATQLTLDISCDIVFASSVEDGVNTYRDEIEAAIAAYIRTVAQSWGNVLVGNKISYPVTVYASRIVYAILSIPEIVSVANLTINGSSGDVTLTESAALQQVPVLGEVTLNV
jgi:uncharacterized phage protein gp47/JayE